MSMRLVSLVALVAGFVSACGSSESVSRARVLDEPGLPIVTPHPDGAAVLGTYEVKFCGFDAAIEPAFNEVVRKVADICRQQNLELGAAGRFHCGADSCTLRGTTQSGGPDRVLRVSLFASSAGAIGFQFSLTPAPVEMPDYSGENLFSCMHPSLYASSRLHARELIIAKAWEGKTLCGSLGN